VTQTAVLKLTELLYDTNVFKYKVRKNLIECHDLYVNEFHRIKISYNLAGRKKVETGINFLHL
jgi:hypothetical protein